MTKTDTPETTAVPVHIAFLDGLRAVAALWVMIGHARLFAIGWTAQRGPVGLLTNWANYMHFAVDIFIVLSGYCLTLPVLRRGSKAESAGKFFLKRARRILPPYYAAVLVCLAIDAVVPFEVWARNAPSYMTQQMPPTVLLTHLFVVQDYFQQFNLINGPFWSIAVEWHIYFLFPAISFVLRKFGGYAAFLFSAVVAGAITWYSLHIHAVSSPYYTGLFGIGVLAAWLGWSVPPEKRAKRLNIATAATLLFAAAVAFLIHRYPIYDLKSLIRAMDHAEIVDPAIGCLTGAGLLMLSLGGDRSRRTAVVYRLLAWRPLAFLGMMSFSLYLIHLPVLAIMKHVIDVARPETHPTPQFFLYALVGGALSIGLSYLFFLAVERPFLARHRRETPAELVRDAVLSPGI